MKKFTKTSTSSRVGFLRKLFKIFNALQKLIPVLIEIIEDYRDDGKLNKSNVKKVEQNES